MLTEKDYCDYDTCVTLGELGFPLKRMKVKNGIDGKITKDTIVPVLLYEDQKWLREDKGLIVLVNHLMTQEGDWEWKLSNRYSTDMYYSYEEALSEGIKEAVKILKQMKQCLNKDKSLNS